MMKPELVRMATSFVVPLADFSPPVNDWEDGPLANTWRTGTRKLSGDREGRRAYVSPGIDDLLYGARWHKFQDPLQPVTPGFRVKGLELVTSPTSAPFPEAFLVVHGRIDGDRSNVFKTLDRALNHNPYHGSQMRSWIEMVANPHAMVHQEHRRAEHVTLATSSGGEMPPLGLPSQGLQSDHNYWLARIASSGRYAPDVDFIDHAGSFIGMSENMRGLVSRSGIAVVGLRPDDGRSDGSDGFDYGGAEFFAEGLYLDVLLLGIMQSCLIDQLRDHIGSARKSGSPRKQLDALELRVVDFRRCHWRIDFAPQGSQNDFLAAYQVEKSMSHRLNDVLSQMNEYSAHIQRYEQRVTNSVLGLAALLGLPMTIAVGVWAGIEERTTGQLAAVFSIAGVVFMILSLLFPGSRWLLFNLFKRRVD